MAANPKVQAFYDAAKSFITRKQAAVVDIKQDFAVILAKIEELNNRPTGWNDEDQALVDEILTLSAELTTDIENAAAIVPPPVVEPPPEG